VVGRRGSRCRSRWVVGTVISTVNQANVIISGQATNLTWLRIAINYLVPNIVSSFAYLTACRKR
jgi:hypothetical protein